MSPFLGFKRRRDEDEDEEEQRYLKKTRNWSFQGQDRPPLNHSPASFYNVPRPCFPPSPPTQTSPTDNEAQTNQQTEDDGEPLSFADSMFYTSGTSNDIDMEDDFDIIGSPPPDSPMMQVFRPPKLNANLFAEPASNTGRIPTPIHGSFYAPRGPVSRSNNTHLHSEFPQFQPPAIRKQVQVDMGRDWRMPSPISEDEDLPDTPTGLTQSQLERLHMTDGNPCETMDADVHNRNVPVVTIEAPPTPTARKGRARSGAFTGKGRFSMGYRDDCDKCRARIPGHYSHFLPG